MGCFSVPLDKNDELEFFYVKFVKFVCIVVVKILCCCCCCVVLLCETGTH